MVNREPNVIEIAGLQKVYYKLFAKKPPVEVLHSISLEVRGNETFCLIGPNGAGKTTLVKILLGITRETGGRVSLFGRSPHEPFIRKTIGYLPERVVYPSAMTGATFLRMSGELHGLKGRVLSRRMSEMFEIFSLKGSAKDVLGNYSKGMLQRIGLAQALLHEANLLILDEPSDGLDPLGRKDLRELLKRLQSKGVTMFINSHILSEVEMIADRIAVIDKGSLLKVGRMEEFVYPSGEYVINVGDKVPMDVRSKLSGCTISDVDGRTSIHVPLHIDFNAVLSVLSGSQIRIASVTSKEITLEESFLNLLQPQSDNDTSGTC